MEHVYRVTYEYPNNVVKCSYTDTFDTLRKLKLWIAGRKQMLELGHLKVLKIEVAAGWLELSLDDVKAMKS